MKLFQNLSGTVFEYLSVVERQYIVHSDLKWNYDSAQPNLVITWLICTSRLLV